MKKCQGCIEAYKVLEKGHKYVRIENGHLVFYASGDKLCERRKESDT